MVMCFQDPQRGWGLSRDAALRASGQALTASCPVSSFPDMASYRLSGAGFFEFPSPKSLERFQRKIQKKGQLVYFSLSGERAELESIHQRRQLLLNELKANSSLLATVPTIDSLVEAEADRLGPFDQQYEAVRTRPSVEILAVSPRRTDGEPGPGKP